LALPPSRHWPQWGVVETQNSAIEAAYGGFETIRDATCAQTDESGRPCSNAWLAVRMLSATCSNGRLQTPCSSAKSPGKPSPTAVTQPNRRNAPLPGRLVGYARVSTEEQDTDPQRDELRAAGCAAIHEEHASGADRTRPVLARLLRDIAAGETLVVVRLDRLARSVSHLLAVIEQLEARGGHFRSLRDPIDTATPQGMFSLQVLGAVAQLERALIAERTKAGLRTARSRGRIGGNPGVRARDPAALRKVRAGRDAAYLNRVLAGLDTWLPTVQQMRPAQPWGDVVRVLNRASGTAWTVERLRRTVRRLVAEGLIETALLDRAPRQPGDDRLVRLVAGIAAAAPDRTLQQIAAQLEAMRERTPRGGTRWHPSSVRHLLARAQRLVLTGLERHPPLQR
jgi:DNA invertase Pin-like site-specific DNA recombinase